MCPHTYVVYLPTLSCIQCFNITRNIPHRSHVEMSHLNLHYWLHQTSTTHILTDLAGALESCQNILRKTQRNSPEWLRHDISIGCGYIESSTTWMCGYIHQCGYRVILYTCRQLDETLPTEAFGQVASLQRWCDVRISREKKEPNPGNQTKTKQQQQQKKHRWNLFYLLVGEAGAEPVEPAGRHCKLYI